MRDAILEAIEWFRTSYGSRNYAFTLRKYQAECIVDGEKRYKVVGIYPQKVEDYYFIVYKKIPIKEKFCNSTYSSVNGDIFEEYRVYISRSGVAS